MQKPVNTYSIVGFDPRERAWGVAVASKFLACAAVVPWARAEVGAIATQSLANLDYGQLALPLLARGYSAQKVLEALLRLDKDVTGRQVGIVDRYGEAAAFTGEGCTEWAGHLTGRYHTCQGNMLANGNVLQAMQDVFLAKADMPLARRLTLALKAGEDAGGDGRGKQAAGLLVVKEGSSYGGYTDKAIDLRVDDSKTPVDDLIRLLELHELYFGKPLPQDILPIEGETLDRLQRALCALGYAQTPSGIWDTAFQKALERFAGKENFEERLLDGNRIDAKVLEFMLQLAGG